MSYLRPQFMLPNQTSSVNSTVAYQQRSLSGSETDVSTSNENLSNEEKYVIRHTARQEPQGQENLLQQNNSPSNRNSLRDSSNRSSLDVSSSSYNTLIIHGLGEDAWTGRNSGPRDQENNLPPSYMSHQMKQGSPSPSIEHNYKIDQPSVQEITEIPADYLNQSSVLKHLAKEVKIPKEITEVNECGPVLYYRGANRKSNNNQNYNMSKSQPDLSKVGLEDQYRFKRDTSVPRPKTKGREESVERGNIWPSVEMVEILIKENSALKMELDQFYKRVAKTQKLEQEVLKIHRSHEELVQSCERRERLERAARMKLQNDCRKLQEINKALKDQIDMSSASDSLKRELNRREVLIAQLITQNKELVAAKERQEIELAAQRATLQEQRTHIDILESALTNAQGNVVRLEEEIRKKQVYADRIIQLQRALSSLQLASDRREQTERQLRQQLELELERTKNNNRTAEHGGKPIPGVVSCDEQAELKKRLREREERIMMLQGECSKWEQRYLEESALRQAAIDAASIPKDAKIAALEKTSQETERIIAEARNEKIRHMDEAHAAQKKVADLESKLKDLESKLAERDAMIRVLHKHTYDKDVSSMLSRSPHHTPHASLAGSELDHVLGSSVSREELVSSVLTNSTRYDSANSYSGSESSYMPSYKYDSSSQNYDSTKKTLDSQIKEIDSQLDSQLMSKRTLCCFPGFTNPVSAQRKTIPKPSILTSVSKNSEANSNGENSRELLLLEKQGRSSQQQRMSDTSGASQEHRSNLPPPPSSLPRPPRTSRSNRYNRLPETDISTRKKSDGGNSLSSNASRVSPARSLIPAPRKLGEYGRLSESGDSSVSFRKSHGSASTFSDNSSGSLPPPSKVRFYSSSPIRRGSSLGRDTKAGSPDSTRSASSSKFRIQF